jgi:hypothetical protein
MMKAQLMAGMALSIIFSGSLIQAAWSKDVATMKHNHLHPPTAPSTDCQLASNPNIRFFQAPDCTPTNNPKPSMDDDEYHNLNEMNQPWRPSGNMSKQLPQEIIYPKDKLNIHFN